MEFINENKINEELVNSFDEKMNLELANRLLEYNHTKQFEGLKEWHLLMPLAIKRPKLRSDYIHLLNKEPFDEK